MATFVQVRKAPWVKEPYKNQKQVKAAWLAAQDFQIVEGERIGSYINNIDATRLGVKVIVRYGDPQAEKVYAVN